MSKVACQACRHEIDSAAKICPYCGSDPTTGQKVVDTNALLQEMFRPRRMSASESVLEYARHRQGVVITISGALLFLILAALHQYVTMRNEALANATSAVPLTEVADLSSQPDETKPQPMPKLDFQYAGNPQAMRTFIVEPGAVAPPPQTATAPQPQPQPQPQ